MSLLQCCSPPSSSSSVGLSRSVEPSTKAPHVSPRDNFAEATAELAESSTVYHGLTPLAVISQSQLSGSVLDAADSLKASSTSVSLSFGKARATLKR